ncbi:hypothetical protein Bca4012_010537 [Brassica carinata]|uniref:Uncharacterized protein n=1 Tax=Brassica carinata TaxID=52824 RepID=A0A8X7V2R7_BRACI|nr:hypothetical protein Bca52824_035453 [Brassica carinata]
MKWNFRQKNHRRRRESQQRRNESAPPPTSPVSHAIPSSTSAWMSTVKMRWLDLLVVLCSFREAAVIRKLR